MNELMFGKHPSALAPPPAPCRESQGLIHSFGDIQRLFQSTLNLCVWFLHFLSFFPFFLPPPLSSVLLPALFWIQVDIYIGQEVGAAKTENPNWTEKCWMAWRAGSRAWHSGSYSLRMRLWDVTSLALGICCPSWTLRREPA